MKNNKVKQPNVIVFDIETSGLLLLGFGLRDQNFSVDHIIEENAMLSFAAYNMTTKEMVQWDTKGSRNDKALLKRAIAYLEKADVLVSQNGVNFDLKTINSRAIVNKLQPNELHEKMHVDLLLDGRRVFHHTSAKLAWLSKNLTPNYIKDNHASFPGIDLWKEVLAKNPKAIKAMADYNIQDVKATTEVYKEYIKWFNHRNLRRSIEQQEKPTKGVGFAPPCRVCGGETGKNGSYRTRQGKLYAKFQCKDKSCRASTCPKGAAFDLEKVGKALNKNNVSLKEEHENLKKQAKLLHKDMVASEARVSQLIATVQKLKKEAGKK